MKTRKIRTALYNVLPGEKAHALMAPRPKYIEGIEGVHPCPPVNSAILALSFLLKTIGPLSQR